MDFVSQRQSWQELVSLYNANRHSVLIEGTPGCGKTYLAKYYADFLGIEDFQVIQPTVQSIREAIDTCCLLENRVVLCIENLDRGVPAASYTLLKFLEEPTDNSYIVVTCRNLNKVPDTIISRSSVISVSPPLRQDIESFAMSKHSSRYPVVSKTRLWSCVRTFGDADTVLRMTDVQLDYFESLSTILTNPDSVSGMMWKIGHYPDNTETPTELVIRYLMELSQNSHIQKCGIECIRDMSQANIAQHIAIAKFCFDIKYTTS